MNKQRTPVRLNALSVPSQIRYLHYYEVLLKSPQVAVSTLRINHIRMTTIPSFSASIVHSGCTPHLTITVLARPEQNISQYSRDSSSDSGGNVWYPKQIYNQLDHENVRRLRRYVTHQDECADFDIGRLDVQVRGDVCLSLHSGEEKMAQLYFHTAFVRGNYLCFDKAAVDVASKDKHCYTFAAGFKIELFVQRVPDDVGINSIGASSSREYVDLGDSVSSPTGGDGDDGGGQTTSGNVNGRRKAAAAGVCCLALDESDEDNDDHNPYAML